MMPKLLIKLDSYAELRHQEPSAITGCNIGIGTAEMMALSPMVIAHASSLRGSETTYCVIASEAKQSFEIASSVASLLPRNDMALAMPQPNDVVMIDRDGGIRLSDAVDSRRKPAPRGAAFRPLSSVISVNPAQILREDLPNSLPVALSGTVPCRAATENGQWTVDYGLKRGKYGI